MAPLSKTQPGLQATKGLHGSLQYTLTLPVSRLQLLTNRVALGLIQTASVHALVCVAIWFSHPALRAGAPGDMFLFGACVGE